MSALPFITAFLVYRARGGADPSMGEAAIADAAAPAMLAAPTLLPRLLTAIETWALPVWSVGVMILAIRLILGRHSCGEAQALRRTGFSRAG